MPGEREHPALALVNSRRNGRHGVIDDLEDAGRLAEWLITAGLASEPLRVGPRELAHVHRLRTAVRELLEAVARSGTPSASAVQTVNEAASAVPAAPRLLWSAGQAPVAAQSTVDADGVSRACARIAGDAIALVTGPDHEAVLACAAPGCIRLLLRDHPRRHWCSTRCGDRVRAARYYDRRRNG